MITDINIKNFKTVVDSSLSLGRFNLLIGANGCGKTNILEAIALAAAASSDKLDYEYFANRGIRVVAPQLMLPAFDDVKADTITVAITNEKRVVFDICYNKGAKPARWESKETILREADSTISQFLIYSLEESKLRNADNSNRTFPMGLHGEGLFAYLKDLAQRPEGAEIFDEIKENLKILDWFDDMQVPSGQLSMEFNLKLKDSYLSETLNTFYQRSTNEGFLYLLFFLTLVISDETPRFFAIENIDTAFNPKLCREVIRRLIELARKHDKQIIATTHNAAVLDGMDINEDDVRLHVVRRTIDGYSVTNRVVLKENMTMSLSEAWLKGIIGGLPDNF